MSRSSELPAPQGPGRVAAMVRRELAGHLPELVLMAAGLSVVALAVPLFTLQVYDRVIAHGGMVTLQGLVLGVVLAVIIDLVLRQARSRLIQRLALRLDARLSREAFDRLAGAPLAVLEKRSSGAWQALFSDVEAVRDTVAGAGVVLLIDLVFVAVYLLVIAVIAPPLLPIVLATLPLFALLAFWSARRLKAAGQQEQSAASERDRLVAQMIQNRAAAKALNLGSALSPHWAELQVAVVRRALLRGACSDAAASLVMTLGSAVTILMTTGGALAILGQSLTMGGLIATNLLMGRIVQPLSQLVGLWKGLGRYRMACERLDEVLAIQAEPQQGAIQRPAPVEGIRLEKLRFVHEGSQRPVIDTIDGVLPTGGIHALAGPNGSGKTTLLKLLMGLLPPSEGRILLDDADLRQFGRAELARWIGYVPQDPILLEGSIRDNLAGFREGISDEAILRAATLAGADSFIIQRPEGYGAPVGEGGRLLSAGQRQRLAIARALVDDPPILLMDEPTAHLDQAGEDALMTHLQAIKPGRLILIATHAPGVLRRADTLIVMRQGRIALAGPAADLLPRLLGGDPQPQPQQPQTAPPAAAPRRAG